MISSLVSSGVRVPDGFATTADAYRGFLSESGIICGQGRSDHPDLAEWLVEQGIISLSLNPDAVTETWLRLARAGSRPGA